MAREDKQHKLSQMLRLLERGLSFTMAALAKQLDVSERTVYTYLRDLRAAGYQIHQDYQKRYHLSLRSNNVNLTFSPQEISLLRDLVANSPQSYEWAHALEKRLTQATQPQARLHSQWVLQLGETLDTIYLALESKQQLVLHNYHSGNSQQIRDRRVCPLLLNEAGTVLVCYEVNDEQVKNFRISRIRRITLLEEPNCYDGPVHPVDFFGYSGEESYAAEVLLDVYAYNHLRESYRQVDAYIEPDQRHASFAFCFRINYRHPEGIGRFLLSMPGHVQILAPEALHTYVCKESGKWRLSSE